MPYLLLSCLPFWCRLVCPDWGGVCGVVFVAPVTHFLSPQQLVGGVYGLLWLQWLQCLILFVDGLCPCFVSLSIQLIHSTISIVLCQSFLSYELIYIISSFGYWFLVLTMIIAISLSLPLSSVNIFCLILTILEIEDTMFLGV